MGHGEDRVLEQLSTCRPAEHCAGYGFTGGRPAGARTDPRNYREVYNWRRSRISLRALLKVSGSMWLAESSRWPS